MEVRSSVYFRFLRSGAGWTITGLYVFNPLEWIPVFAAFRLGRPDFYWAAWFYGAEKMARASARFCSLPSDPLKAKQVLEVIEQSKMP
jgi:hypothetical protein